MCDTIVVVERGRVLFAKNSDRDPNEAQLLEWTPAATHRPGATRRCTWIEIPQVPRTHATLVSRPFWMWGAEIGANEYAVAIGNEAVFTRQPHAKMGLTGMDLVRLGLERANTAAMACQVIQGLLRAFGQGGGCGHENRRFTYHNSFIIADPREAYVLETAGPYTAVEKVQGVRTISNGLSIPAFAAEHSDILKTRISACRLRQQRTTSLADGARGPAELISILSDHGGQASPQYRWLNGAMSNPCMHAGGWIAASQTTASWVSELRPGNSKHWATATAAPCISLFKPVDVQDPLDLGPSPTDIDDNSSLWWRHEAFHRRVLRDPDSTMPLFASRRSQVQQRWLGNPPTPQQAFEEANVLLEEWTHLVEQSSPKDRRPFHVRRYWRTRNRRAKLLL